MPGAGPAACPGCGWVGAGQHCRATDLPSLAFALLGLHLVPP